MWLDPAKGLFDFRVLSDKDDKPEVPSHKPCSHITLWDVKEPIHYSKRVGDVVPGVVVYLHSLTSPLIVGRRVWWAHNWIDSGCHRRPQNADVRAHRKKHRKEDMYVCPHTRDIYIYILFTSGDLGVNLILFTLLTTKKAIFRKSTENLRVSHERAKFV